MTEFIFDTPTDDRSGKPLISLRSAVLALWLVVVALVAIRVVLSSHGLLFHFSPSTLATWAGLK